MKVGKACHWMAFDAYVFLVDAFIIYPIVGNQKADR